MRRMFSACERHGLPTRHIGERKDCGCLQTLTPRTFGFVQDNTPPAKTVRVKASRSTWPSKRSPYIPGEILQTAPLGATVKLDAVPSRVVAVSVMPEKSTSHPVHCCDSRSQHKACCSTLAKSRRYNGTAFGECQHGLKPCVVFGFDSQSSLLFLRSATSPSDARLARCTNQERGRVINMVPSP